MELPEFFSASQGLPALFVLSFLAATVLPLGSEWLLVLLILGGHHLPAAVAVATLGNYLGACTTYLIGILGSDFFIKKILRLGENEYVRASVLFRRYGAWSLLLSWLPIVGDPLCLLAGTLRTPFPLFSFFVLLGKAGRYTVVAVLSLQGYS
jgi:membrane protein YqaA with SNARE-associated domain